jgi:hypothetical protein
MEDKEVIKRWEYDNSLIFWKVPSLKKQLGETKTAKGNIHAIQWLTLDERQMMNKNADSI